MTPLSINVEPFSGRIFRSPVENEVCVAVTAERWCRLRGNLLFYFKSRTAPSPRCPPTGLLVLENLSVVQEDPGQAGTFGLVIRGAASRYFIVVEGKPRPALYV